MREEGGKERGRAGGRVLAIRIPRRIQKIQANEAEGRGESAFRKTKNDGRAPPSQISESKNDQGYPKKLIFSKSGGYPKRLEFCNFILFFWILTPGAGRWFLPTLDFLDFLPCFCFPSGDAPSPHPPHFLRFLGFFKGFQHFRKSQFGFL